MRSLLLPIALLLGAAAAAQTPAPTSTFHDEQLKATFTYPSTFLPQPTPDIGPQVHKDTGEEAANLITKCTSIPFLVLHNMEAEHQAEILLMTKVDFTCMGAKMEPEMLTIIATTALQQGLQKIGPPTLLPARTYKLGTVDAVFVQGSAPDATDGNPGYSGVACMLLQNNVACWMGLTAYPTHFKQLFSNKLALADQPAQPLVPADSITVPTGKDPAPAATKP